MADRADWRIDTIAEVVDDSGRWLRNCRNSWRVTDATRDRAISDAKRSAADACFAAHLIAPRTVTVRQAVRFARAVERAV